MIGRSLRVRLVASGATAIVIALSVAGFALTILFERHVARTLAADLEVHLRQLLAGVEFNAAGQLNAARPPVDPRFSDPLSGLYWQMGDDHGQLVRSRSLWDMTLSLPSDELALDEGHFHEVAGPAGSRLMLVERQVSLHSVADKQSAVTVAVAADMSRVSAAGAAFAQDLVMALGLLGLILALATSAQLMLGLRPLRSLQSGISDIRSGRKRRLPLDVPTEVMPLVEEVNAMIDAQERQIERSRGRAADLAHGLKTPLAALAADAVRLVERGEKSIAAEIETVVKAMSRHVDRELARARLRGDQRRRPDVSTELGPLVRSLLAILSRTRADAHITFEHEIQDGTTLSFDRADLAEVLGNLLDNAVRHATSRVRISSIDFGDGHTIVVEDDGCGINPNTIPSVLERGIRLDQRGGGAGLGLSIVQEVLDAYGWQLVLERSTLGGLKAECRPPNERRSSHEN